MKTLLPLYTLILFSGPLLAVEKTEFYEFLNPMEKKLLENAIDESDLPSLCSKTKEFADLAQWTSNLGNSKADFVLVDKKRRLTHLLLQGEVLATYRIALGENPLGQKTREGDMRTPEGLYFFDLKNKKSDYHLSLRINYPNPRDIAKSVKNGIQDPGKDIMIHGLPNSWLKRKLIRHPRDWTRGCIAVTNEQITEIFSSVDLGTLVEICP